MQTFKLLSSRMSGSRKLTVGVPDPTFTGKSANVPRQENPRPRDPGPQGPKPSPQPGDDDDDPD
jgi:hypothetical protein